MASPTGQTNPEHRPAPLASDRPWILSRGRDLVFFVATPLLILPIAGLAGRGFSAEEIGGLVAAFGAGGHHLPGMIRAYGDRELFRRFRIRFLAAPVLLLAVCLADDKLGFEVVPMIALAWGLWHGAAQVYGFERIYDAKLGSSAPLTARLDMGVTLAWFVAGVLNSPGRVADVANVWYSAGGPLIPADVFHTGVAAWTGATGLVSVAWAANFVRCQIAGRPQSLVKLLLIVTTVAFWWFAMVTLDNVVLGVALFEIFHDVQYLAIVWIYNRKRVEQTADMGAVSRFVFRPKAVLIGVYVGLVIAYGALGQLKGHLGAAQLNELLTGWLQASALLHFYFDGFIWKVRERETRAGLGLASDDEALAPSALPTWAVHTARWGAFVVPLVLLGLASASGKVKGIARQESVVALAPADAASQAKLGVAYEDAGRIDDAIRQYRESLRVDPDLAVAHTNLGGVLQVTGDLDGAVTHLDRALELDPLLVKAQNNLAWLRATSADPRFRDPAEAVRLAEASTSRRKTKPLEYGTRLDTLAVAYAAAGRFDEAVDAAERAVAQLVDEGRHELAAEAAVRLEMFRRGEVYR